MFDYAVLAEWNAVNAGACAVLMELLNFYDLIRNRVKSVILLLSMGDESLYSKYKNSEYPFLNLQTYIYCLY